MRTCLLSIVLMVVCAAIGGCGAKTRSVGAPTSAATPAVASPAPTPPPQPPIWPEVVVTNSGLRYRDTKVGPGDEVRVGDKVTIHYKGWLDNGRVFGKSKRPGGGPITFKVGEGEVISGWDEGLVGMKVGGIRELTIPPSLGYGDRAYRKIPANSTLHMRIYVVKVDRR